MHSTQFILPNKKNTRAGKHEGLPKFRNKRPSAISNIHSNPTEMMNEYLSPTLNVDSSSKFINNPDTATLNASPYLEEAAIFEQSESPRQVRVAMRKVIPKD